MWHRFRGAYGFNQKGSYGLNFVTAVEAAANS